MKLALTTMALLLIAPAAATPEESSLLPSQPSPDGTSLPDTEGGSCIALALGSFPPFWIDPKACLGS